MVAHFPFCPSFSTCGNTLQMPRVDPTAIVMCLDTFPFKPIPYNGIIWWCHALCNLYCLPFQSRFFAQLFYRYLQQRIRLNTIVWIGYDIVETWRDYFSPNQLKLYRCRTLKHLLACYVVSTGRKLTTFRMRLMFPSSGSNHQLRFSKTGAVDTASNWVQNCSEDLYTCQ